MAILDFCIAATSDSGAREPLEGFESDIAPLGCRNCDSACAMLFGESVASAAVLIEQTRVSQPRLPDQHGATLVQGSARHSPAYQRLANREQLRLHYRDDCHQRWNLSHASRLARQPNSAEMNPKHRYSCHLRLTKGRHNVCAGGLPSRDKPRCHSNDDAHKHANHRQIE